jgi:hypothetical protein
MVLLVVAGTFRGRRVDLLLSVTMANAAARSILDADSRVVEPGERAEVKSIHRGTTLKMVRRWSIPGGKDGNSSEKGELHCDCGLGKTKLQPRGKIDR